MRLRPHPTRRRPARPKPRFDTLDADGSGEISVDEIIELLGSLDANAKSLNVEEVVRAADTDQSGEIDFDEFVEWFLKQNGGPDAQLAPVLEKLGFTHYAEVRTPRTIRP